MKWKTNRYRPKSGDLLKSMMVMGHELIRVRHFCNMDHPFLNRGIFSGEKYFYFCTSESTDTDNELLNFSFEVRFEIECEIKNEFKNSLPKTINHVSIVERSFMEIKWLFVIQMFNSANKLPKYHHGDIFKTEGRSMTLFLFARYTYVVP